MKTLQWTMNHKGQTYGSSVTVADDKVNEAQKLLNDQKRRTRQALICEETGHQWQKMTRICLPAHLQRYDDGMTHRCLKCRTTK